MDLHLQDTSTMPAPHVLITGGSRGIGLSIATAFARNAYRCTLVSRSEESLKEAVSHLDDVSRTASTTSAVEPPTTHSFIAGDISSNSFWSSSGIGTYLPMGRDHANKINVLVNCAGLTQTRLFQQTDTEEIERILDTNLRSVLVGTRFLLRNRYFHARVNDGAINCSIINVASLLATHGGHGAVVYAASKAGVLGFTRALSTELGRQGIRVNAIVPGYVETDMTKGTFYVVSLLVFCGCPYRPWLSTIQSQISTMPHSQLAFPSDVWANLKKLHLLRCSLRKMSTHTIAL